ncbi:hypothetical protein GQ600_22006 [Phytophthora cactorum]|nr:hypothetical protein GQ600_22006 [Phytophthora cactorum]
MMKPDRTMAQRMPAFMVVMTSRTMSISFYQAKETKDFVSTRRHYTEINPPGLVVPKAQYYLAGRRQAVGHSLNTCNILMAAHWWVWKSSSCLAMTLWFTSKAWTAYSQQITTATKKERIKREDANVVHVMLLFLVIRTKMLSSRPRPCVDDAAIPKDEVAGALLDAVALELAAGTLDVFVFVLDAPPLGDEPGDCTEPSPASVSTASVLAIGDWSLVLELAATSASICSGLRNHLRKRPTEHPAATATRTASVSVRSIVRQEAKLDVAHVLLRVQLENLFAVRMCSREVAQHEPRVRGVIDASQYDKIFHGGRKLFVIGDCNGVRVHLQQQNKTSTSCLCVSIALQTLTHIFRETDDDPFPRVGARCEHVPVLVRYQECRARRPGSWHRRLVTRSSGACGCPRCRRPPPQTGHWVHPTEGLHLRPPALCPPWAHLALRYAAGSRKPRRRPVAARPASAPRSMLPRHREKRQCCHSAPDRTVHRASRYPARCRAPGAAAAEAPAWGVPCDLFCASKNEKWSKGISGKNSSFRFVASSGNDNFRICFSQRNGISQIVSRKICTLRPDGLGQRRRRPHAPPRSKRAAGSFWFEVASWRLGGGVEATALRPRATVRLDTSAFHPQVQFNIDDFTEDTCLFFYRFTHQQLRKLQVLFRLPDVIRTGGHSLLAAAVWKGYVSCFTAWLTRVDVMKVRCKTMLQGNLDVVSSRLPEFSQAIYDQGAELDHIWGFVDGTRRDGSFVRVADHVGAVAAPVRHGGVQVLDAEGQSFALLVS